MFENDPFPINSRYHRLGSKTIELPSGKVVRYLNRRFVPKASRFHLLQEHSVVQDDRLDNIAAAYLEDPSLFWRICDANNALKPAELTEEPGRKLRITPPEDFPGANHA